MRVPVKQVRLIRTIAFCFTEARMYPGLVLDVIDESPRGVWVLFEGERCFLTNIAEPFDYREADIA